MWFGGPSSRWTRSALVLLILLEVARCCRVAVVFVGHARTFSKPAVHMSIKQQLLDFGGRGCEVRVFWYFSEAPDWSTKKRAYLEELFAPVAQATATADVKEMSSCPMAALAPQLDGVPSSFKFYEDPSEAARIARALFQRFEEAFKLVIEDEKNGRYDFIVRARFDAGWYAPLPEIRRLGLSRVYLPALTWNGFNDQFAVVPRVFAEDYFAAGTYLDRCSSLGVPLWSDEGRVWQPETMLYSHLREREVPVGRITIPAVVHRSDGDTRCLDLMPLTLLGTVVDALTRVFFKGEQSFPHIAKTAHVAACAARFACCRLDVTAGGNTTSRTISPFAAAEAARSVCPDEECSSRFLAQLRSLSAVAEDAALAEDLGLMDGVIRALKDREEEEEEDIVIQINSHVQETSSAPAAARDAAWHRRIVVADSVSTTVRLWRALRCAYLTLVPRAEALAGGGSCTSSLLDRAEWLLDSMVDQTALTNPKYSSLSTTTTRGALGWQVWTLPRITREEAGLPVFRIGDRGDDDDDDDSE